jgi:hypothetical protein
MDWNQISFERNIWQIHDTKNGDTQNIHLSEEAIKILQSTKLNTLQEPFK